MCSQTVRGYEHFGEGQRGKCPLHDNVEDRHEQEVKQAAEEAMAKVRLDHPELSDADLMTKVSDRVKQAEDVRRGRAAEGMSPELILQYMLTASSRRCFSISDARVSTLANASQHAAICYR